MTITYYPDLVQGSEEWKATRLGLLTASEMKHIITPSKLAYSESEKEKAHLYELAAQRISNYVEPSYIGDDILRGFDDEIEAKKIYSEQFAPVNDMGFMTNDKWGYTIGYSPDGLVGEDGAIECKSRRQKFQVETILNGIPKEHVIQVQTGLLVSERQWIDYVSYCGGLPMAVWRILPDEKIQDAILSACDKFHHKMNEILLKYADMINGNTARFVATERKAETTEEIR